jgi:hypothetical protein
MDLVYGLMLTLHLGLCEDCNPFNPFVGLERPVSESLTLGGRVFYNSYEEVGALVGVSYSFDRFEVDLGLAFGYEAAPVAPMISVGYQLRSSSKVFVAPITNEDASEWGAIIGLEIKL